MKVFVYVVAASKNPDAVECVVPYEVDKDLIFFGPCKKRLRENFYKWYLRNSLNGEADVSSENLYVVGVNGSNAEKKRKIVWTGRVLKILTFERAYHCISLDKRFKEMMQRQDSPLHLEPIYDSRKTFIGYRLRSSEHEKNDEWILDVIKKKNDPNVEIKNKSLILRDPSKRKEIFLRDCCFFCKNIFFANEKGIDIDAHILNIFKYAQPNKGGVDNYAIFGLRKDGSADGLTGSYLEIGSLLARNLIDIIAKKSVVQNSPRRGTYRCGGKCR